MPIKQKLRVLPFNTVRNISFSNNFWHFWSWLPVAWSRGPRKMRCIFDSIPSSAIEPGGIAPTQTELPIRHLDQFPSIRFGRSKSSSVKPSPHKYKDGEALVLKSKPPRWHDQLQCWCLNFHGRVTIASVKNFQLVAASQPEPSTPLTTNDKEPIIIQFGKVGKDLFTMDYRYPVSAFQAFAVCLSSFASNVSCE